MRMIKVLVVDDSAFMRRQLTAIIDGAEGLVVVDTARNGEEAVRKVEQLKPDVVTLDINMPIMDGLTALATIMMTCPTPCLMISSLTQEGATATFEALELGAVDFVAKPSGTVSLDIDLQAHEIVTKLRVIASARLRRTALSANRQQASEPRFSKSPRYAPRLDRAGVVAIGVSTGGPQTLMEILPRLTAELAVPVVIVQHMPAQFTATFAKRIDEHCELPAKEAEHLEPLLAGHIYLAPGGLHLTVARGIGSQSLVAHLSKRPDGRQFRPSVDVLFDSVALQCGAWSVGVLLTGMGDDGADGMVRIRAAGGTTIAESEATCVVFGMPREAIARNGVDVIAPCTEIAVYIRRAVQKLAA